MPIRDDNIVVYNKTTGEYKSLPIDNARNWGYYDPFVKNNKIYLLPFYAAEIIVYDMVTDEITKNNKICGNLDNIFGKPKRTAAEFYFAGSAALNETELLLPYGNGNAVVKYDIKTDEHQILRVGSAGNKYFSIVFDGDNYWLLAFDKIVKWNIKDNKTTELTGFPDGFTPGRRVSFSFAIVYDGNLFVFPNQSNMILQIDITTNDINLFTNLDERKESRFFTPNGNRYLTASLVGDYIYAVSNYEYVLQKIDPKTKEIENISIELPDEVYSDLRLFDNAERFMHERYTGLRTFLDKLTTENKINYTPKNTFANANFDGTCGKKTYETLKAQIWG
jgi:hypothetical protein